MKYIVKFLIVISSLWLLEAAQAQSPITYSAHLSVDNYLKDRLINKIDRDKSGVFWLLENSVIQRYDGRFVTEKIPHPVVNPKYFKCLSDNTILIVSHESRIFTLDKEDKVVQQIDTKIPNCANCELIDVNLVGEKLILYFQNNEQIHIYTTEDRQTFTLIDELSFSQPNSISNIFKVGDSFLVTTSEDRVFRIKGEEELELSVPPYFREINEAVISNYVDSTTLYFSFSKRNGTYLFDGNQLQVVTPTEKLVFAKRDRKGRILLALSRSFLHSEVIKIIENDKIIDWPELAEINNTFLDAYVEDVNDKILLASHIGLFFVELKKSGIEAYHQSSSLRSGFGNVILSFTQTSEGDIYYVKENKGIFKFEGEHNPTSLEISDQLLNNLTCEYDPTDHNIWISGYTNERKGVLYSYDYRQQTVERHDFDRPVMFFKRWDDDEFILSTSLIGESYILKYNTERKLITDTLAILMGERTRNFDFYHENKLLIGTSKRLILYDFDEQTIQTIIPEIRVQSIVKTSTGFGICTIGKGAIFLDDNLQQMKQVTESSGLTNNQIYSITEDLEGRFWIGSGKGLSVLDSNYEYIRNFRVYDGLSSYELNTNASLVLQDGNLLFGTINGVTEIKPALALSSAESVVLNIAEVSYLKKDDRIIQNLGNGEIIVPSDARDLTLTLERNDFYKYNNIDNPIAPRIQTFPSDIEYTYEEDEIKIEKLETKETTLNIYPANPLKASQKISLTLVRKKNYQSLLLFLGLILLAGLMSYFIAKRVIKYNTIKENERRENEVKMAELELQALRSQMNPHFIFNSLGAILLYLQTNEKKKAEKYLTKFAKLMRMFLESSKSKFISFAEEQELLDLYLELEKLRFEDKFEYEIALDPRIDKNNWAIPSMLLQPFVENAINHGLYHKKGNDGKLTIMAVPDKEHIKVIIRDNGVGRAKSREIQSNSLKKHRSRATEIIQERLAVLKAEKNIDIDIVYNDLVDSDALPCGTEVILTIQKILKRHD